MNATRLQSWTCPLCLRRTARTDALRHGTTTHPATLPARMTTADRLRLIPALAHEVELTIGAPNPSNRADHTRRTAMAHPSLPIDAAALDALAPDDGLEEFSHVPISRLVECSRLIWDAIDEPTRHEHPQPVGDPAFHTECAWLAGVWPDAQAWLDPLDFHWIESETRAICSLLASAARLTREPRYLCPDCSQPMHLGLGDWMVCESGAHTHPGPGRLERDWRRRGPMSTNSVCAALRIPKGTLDTWRDRGKLAPHHREGRTDMWLPWDVIRVRYPDIVAAIDARDEKAG